MIDPGAPPSGVRLHGHRSIDLWKICLDVALDTQGIDDALIQPYSGHASRTSLEIYSKIALGPAQSYDGVIDHFPV